MDQNSKQKAHQSCSCEQCKRGAGTAFGQCIQHLNEKKLRSLGKQELKKVVQGGERELEEVDVISKINSPYTD